MDVATTTESDSVAKLFTLYAHLVKQLFYPVFGQSDCILYPPVIVLGGSRHSRLRFSRCTPRVVTAHALPNI